MAIQVKHSKVSTIPDTDDTSLVRPSDWNADHVLTGTISVANGGTGADNPTDARTNLSAAKSGANSDITSMTGVTGGISSPDYIQFDTTYATTLTTGQLGWDGNDTLGLGMSGGNVVQEIGLQTFIYGKASSAITKGQLIKKTGANGSSGVITFAPTTANMTNSTDIIGIAAEDIALNGFGYIMSTGNLRGFNTTGASSGETWADGDTLYYNPAGNGLMTKTKPSAPNSKTEVAVVTNAGSGGSGSVVVEIIHGSQLGGTDSNVQITSPTTGQTLVYNQSTNIWNNSNAPTIIGGSINNTPIGATTPDTGAFTTLTASGVTTLGANGSNNQTFVASAGTGAFPNIVASHQSGIARLAASYPTGNSSLMLSARGTGGSVRLVTNLYTDEQVRITHTGSSVNYINMTGAATTTAPVISAQGSDTNIPLVLQPKGTGALQAQQTDSTATGGNARGANAVDWQTTRNAAAQVASGQNATIGGGDRNTASGFMSAVFGGFNSTSSASYTFIGAGYQNSATGRGATISGGYGNSAAGFWNFIGSGALNSGTASAAVTTQATTTVTSGSTAVTLSGSNANIRVGQLVTGTGINDFPNTYVAAISGTSLTLSQNANASGSPTLSFFTPHGVVVGGGNNQATGAYSFIGGGGDAGTAANRNVASGDWSVVCGGWRATASGAGSAVVGGGNNGAGGVGANTASGIGAFIGAGFSNTASGNFSGIPNGYASIANGAFSFVGGGTYGTTRGIAGLQTFPASQNPIASIAGVSQTSFLVLGVETTDATATVLRSNSSAAGTTNQVILPNNSAYYFIGEVVSGVTGGGNSKGWEISGLIKRGANAAATTLVGSTVTSLYADAGAATWTIALAADTTNGGLRVTFTGQAGTTIRTVCQIRTTEMTY